MALPSGCHAVGLYIVRTSLAAASEKNVPRRGVAVVSVSARRCAGAVFARGPCAAYSRKRKKHRAPKPRQDSLSIPQD
jgi:hypothetical protein